MTTADEIKEGLEALKTKVTNLKVRATKLTATREDLIRQAATLEQTKVTALADLKEMGIEPKDLQPATLAALNAHLNSELAAAVNDLERTVAGAEALVG